MELTTSVWSNLWNYRFLQVKICMVCLLYSDNIFHLQNYHLDIKKYGASYLGNN